MAFSNYALHLKYPRVQVPNDHILPQNLYYNDLRHNPRYPIIKYRDPTLNPKVSTRRVPSWARSSPTNIQVGMRVLGFRV